MSDETTGAITESKPKLSEAISQLDGFEVCGIEDYWGQDLGGLTGTKLTMSVLWARRRREGMKPADAWQAVKRMTLAEMDASFAPEDDQDGDQADDDQAEAPEQDVGKGDSVKRGPARSSRSGRGSRPKSSAA